MHLQRNAGEGGAGISDRPNDDEVMVRPCGIAADGETLND
jgi:hypothetical protein